MNLSEVRKNINDIDDKMKNTFDERMQCSKEVAIIKIRDNDQVFKPLREKEICERFADEKWYLPYIKKVMQISRKYQYSLFVDKGITDDGFNDFLGNNSIVLEKGGILTFSLNADATAEEGLAIKDIISIIADSQLNLNEISADRNTGKVNLSLSVSDTEEEKQEAFLISYMLYKETITM